MSRSAAPRPDNLKFVEPLHSPGAGRGVRPAISRARRVASQSVDTAVEGGALLLSVITSAFRLASEVLGVLRRAMRSRPRSGELLSHCADTALRWEPF